MTDNEITKALEDEMHIANDIGDVHSMMIQIRIIKDAIDLINRQKEEIGWLKKVIETMTNEQIQFGFDAKRRIENAKSEAIKEVKEKLQWDVTLSDRVVYERDINAILKEIGGDNT